MNHLVIMVAINLLLGLRLACIKDVVIEMCHSLLRCLEVDNSPVRSSQFASSHLSKQVVQVKTNMIIRTTDVHALISFCLRARFAADSFSCFMFHASCFISSFIFQYSVCSQVSALSARARLYSYS